MGQLMLGLIASNTGVNICHREIESHRRVLKEHLGYTRENELGGNKR